MVALVLYDQNGNLSIFDDYPVDYHIADINFGRIWDIFLSDVPAPFVQCC